MTIGDQLSEICRSSTPLREVVLIAPFIKTGALSRLLSCCEDYAQITCVTRWRTEEVLAGVSDLEVWQLMEARPNSRLLLTPALHAKYFRFDGVVLVGSANITAAALGWSAFPNIELLVQPAAAERNRLQQWEESVVAGAILVDAAYYRTFSDLVAEARASAPLAVSLEALTEAAPSEWRPSLRHPESLYVAYLGHLYDLTDSTRDSAIQDLRALEISPGLPEPVFLAAVRSRLLTSQLFLTIDRFVAQPRRFGEIRRMLREDGFALSHDDATDLLQTAIRWLRTFFPQRYSVAESPYSEVMSRNA